MDDKIKELLAVLDMTEEEQEKWVESRVGLNVIRNGFALESLADLAFRLRPQPSKEYHQALKIVYDYLWRKGKVSCDYVNWLEFHITPEDRIIAALIAKELAKKGE